MTRKLKVAVVGLGIGRQHILHGFQPNAELFEVVALCDTNASRLKEVGDEFGIDVREKSFESLLEHDEIDVFDICTPAAIHKAYILAALRTGKHVICEKPLVGSLADIDELLDAETRSSGRVMPIMQYRYKTGVQQAKHVIDSGLAGKPYLATCETHWHCDADYYAETGRSTWTEALGGTLMNHAIHTNDLLFYLMGSVRSLFARIATRVNRIEVEDCASISVEMKCGAIAAISATTGSVEEISRMRLCFENLTIESDNSPYCDSDGDGWRFIPANENIAARLKETLGGFTPGPTCYAGQMRDFHQALCNKTPLPMSLSDARQSIDFATAAYWSAKTYSAVALPVMPDHPFYNGWQNAF